MARSAITITDLTINAGVAAAAGHSLADIATNGGYLATDDTNGLVLRANNTAGGAKNLTVKSGVNPPAIRAMGDLVNSVGASGVEFMTLESARFVQTNGQIWIDAEAGMTGTLEVYRLPKGV